MSENGFVMKIQHQKLGDFGCVSGSANNLVHGQVPVGRSFKVVQGTRFPLKKITASMPQFPHVQSELIKFPALPRVVGP